MIGVYHISGIDAKIIARNYYDGTIHVSWENGETLPDIKSCFEIAKIFNISLDDLLEYKTKDAGLKKQIPNKNFKNNNFLKPPKGKHIFGAVTLGEKD